MEAMKLHFEHALHMLHLPTILSCPGGGSECGIMFLDVS